MMSNDPSQWFGDQIRIDVYTTGRRNAVRITHLPTGVVATSEEDASQLHNRRQAGRMLLKALLAKAENEH